MRVCFMHAVDARNTGADTRSSATRAGLSLMFAQKMDRPWTNSLTWPPMHTRRRGNRNRIMNKYLPSPRVLCSVSPLTFFSLVLVFWFADCLWKNVRQISSINSSQGFPLILGVTWVVIDLAIICICDKSTLVVLNFFTGSVYRL